jgi:hypothetical protein
MGLVTKMGNVYLEYVQIVRRIGVFLAAGTLLTAAALSPRDAVAHIGRCNSPSLLPGDEERVTAAARRILPPDIDPVVSNRCVLPNGAYAQISSAKVPDSAGVKHWWVADCHRELGDWSCDPAASKQEVERRLVIDGMARQVAITIDTGTPIDAAQSLVTRALGLYLSPGSILPYCGGLKDGESRWRSLREHQQLLSGEARFHVTVQQWVVTAVVLFDEVIQPDDMKIQMQFPIGHEKQDSTAPCWNPMAA